ncbi:transmembrane protein 255B isoform X3 [Phacochoerus africanus]|uniref:transmembrane protein 255B isoform X3 n=1 Tax=Phacochoerus africanus TaxID=41426 RepID=UPI001FD9D4E0|nr:transmembrane protein 255B isoform X3 [Phacochoerus africanus]
MQPLPPPEPRPLALLDTTGELTGFARRKKTSLWFVGSLLVVSTFILTLGLTANTRTENVAVGGYYPGVVLGFGSFLGIIGIHLVENRRQMLVAAVVFISFGVVAAFCCAIVDGVFAARHICLFSFLWLNVPAPSGAQEGLWAPTTLILKARVLVRPHLFPPGEPRPLVAGRCQFYSSEVGYLHDVYQTEVTCHSLNGQCQLKVKGDTCYCCDLYNCQSTEHPATYYEFVGVSSCQDVLHLYRLLWASAMLNVLGLFLGIVTAAVLGAFKDMVPLSQLAYGPSSPPQTLYNPAQQILAYAGFCQAPPAGAPCSSFPLPLQKQFLHLCISVGPGETESLARVLVEDTDTDALTDRDDSARDTWTETWRDGASLKSAGQAAGRGPGKADFAALSLKPSCTFTASPCTDLSLSEDVWLPSQSSSGCRLPPNAPPVSAPTCFLPGEKPPPYAP